MAHPIVIDEVKQRWPRLLATVRWQGNLSTSEAVDAILCVRMKRTSWGEAVSHYGGAEKLIHDARRNWPDVRGWMREWGIVGDDFANDRGDHAPNR